MISLDGVVESPGIWQFNFFNYDMIEGMKSSIQTDEVVLLGRKTYEEWHHDWPISKHEPYASFINNVQKDVISKTLQKVEWNTFNNISIINTDIEMEIKKIKNSPGEKISVEGSLTLVLSLLGSNLIDKLTLMIYPVIVGKGKKLFEKEDKVKRMTLVNSKQTSSGVMILTYVPLTENTTK